MSQVITKELLAAILDQYDLDEDGIHGLSHWARVLENGLKIAKHSGANTKIVSLFAVFHDSRRISDGYDPMHGKRGGELAKSFRGKYFELSDQDFTTLNFACRFHTDGGIHSDPTIGTCWDADRLDLGRVGYVPFASKMSTAPGKDQEVICWALERSRDLYRPKFMDGEWP